ncbi:LamG domain-containing protein [uncultured Draconibacterium sp.]|uniref:LamG domain-containing protein n=1 Tax=uncultured Draconibacterium sp. TaxID=1573823 RepID=UPI0032171A10
MKKRFLLLVFLFVSVFISTAQNLQEGIVSVWELDETSGSVASDSYGANDGTIYGCTLNQSSVTTLSTSYSFDGSDRVNVNGAASADYSQGASISLWIKPNIASYSWDGKIFDMGSSSANRITLAMKSSLKMYFGVGQVNYASYATISSAWHHIVLKWERPNLILKLYIDGSLYYSGTSGDPIISTYANIGNEYNNGASRYFQGGLDQVAIWNRALTSEEILQLYNSGNGLPYSEWNILTDTTGGDWNHSATQNIRLNNYWLSNDGGNEGIRIDNTGNVGINTTNLDGYDLAVGGKIHAEEVVVETGWADYVFDAEYQLKSLSELENFIKSNGHLPEIPLASEVEKNGIGLAEMNLILLKKIEELTLYVLKQQKEIEDLKIVVSTNHLPK